MEVGEYHLPATLGCNCWQAWPWVLKVNYGVGHGNWSLCPSAQSRASWALSYFLTLSADPGLQLQW